MVLHGIAYHPFCDHHVYYVLLLLPTYVSFVNENIQAVFKTRYKGQPAAVNCLWLAIGDIAAVIAVIVILLNLRPIIDSYYS